MTYKHKNLAQGRWFEFSFVEQMANIGGEVERAIIWREKNRKYSLEAIDRAPELLDLAVVDKRNIKRLKELLRLREALVDYFYFDNQYGSSDKLWHSYFHPFFYAARRRR